MAMSWQAMVFIYFIIINLAGFISMGVDKYKARMHMWRIPEKTLFLLAILGGAAGCLAGMYLFRHKTRHWYFVLGMPAIIATQAAAILFIWLRT